MKKRILFTLLLAFVMLYTVGCNTNEAAPPVSDPAGTGRPSADKGATENDIAPVPDQSKQTASVKKTYTFFFADKELMGMYRVAQEVEAASEKDLPLAALKLWLKGPDNDKLNNLVPPGVVVESLEFKEDTAYISFSRELKNGNLGSTGELYVIDQIAQLMKQFGGNKTQILIAGQMEESIFGHVTTNIPIAPSDPEQYPWLK